MFKFHLIPDVSENGGLLPAVHGGGDGSTGGGWVGLLDGFLEKITGILESGASFEFFPGVKALASNVHPLIVHFPIGFLTAFFLFELAGVALRKEELRRTASWLLYLGVLGALMAVAAGLVAEDTVPHGEEVHAIMGWHGRLGITVASLSLVLAAWRIAAKANFSPMAKSLHLSLAAIMVICLFLGADLGGLMVYQYGVGVKSLQQPDEHHHPADTASEQNVEDGQLHEHEDEDAHEHEHEHEHEPNTAP